MKIETSIIPRRDGTVRLALPSGNVAEFKDADGVLVCDIKDEQDIAYAIGLDGFYPHDDEVAHAILDKKALMADAKRLGVPDFNGRMSAETIAAKIEAFKAEQRDETEE